MTRMKLCTSLLMCTLVVSAQAQAQPVRLIKTAFEETLDRYPSPYALIQQLKRIVPSEAVAEANSQACRSLTSVSAPAIGVIEPLLEGALEPVPGPLFYPFYMGCVRTLVAGGFDSLNATTNAEKILGKSVRESLEASYCAASKFVCEGDPKLRDYMIWATFHWSALSSEIQMLVMKRWLLYLVGPDPVLRSTRLIGPGNSFDADIHNSFQLAEFLSAALSTVLNQKNAPLTVSEAYAETAIVLRLGEAVRN